MYLNDWIGLVPLRSVHTFSVQQWVTCHDFSFVLTLPWFYFIYRIWTRDLWLRGRDPIHPTTTLGSLLWRFLENILIHISSQLSCWYLRSACIQYQWIIFIQHPNCGTQASNLLNPSLLDISYFMLTAFCFPLLWILKLVRLCTVLSEFGTPLRH